MASAKYSITNYTEMLVNLFPQGRAFLRHIFSDFWQFVEGFAVELFRIDGSIRTLVIDELHSETTTELIPEWLIEVGLPNDVIDIDGFTDAQKRSYIQWVERGGFLFNVLYHSSVVVHPARGGQSEQFFIDTARFLGYTITFDNTIALNPLRVGENQGFDANPDFRVGEDQGMGGADAEIGGWPFTTNIVVSATPAGDPTALILIAWFDKIKPAHANFIYTI